MTEPFPPPVPALEPGPLVEGRRLGHDRGLFNPLRRTRAQCRQMLLNLLEKRMLILEILSIV